MKTLENINEAQDNLIYIARGNNIEIDYNYFGEVLDEDDEIIKETKYKSEQEFNFICLNNFLELINYLNINMNIIDKDDLHILKNTLLAYHNYVKYINIDCSNTDFYEKDVEQLKIRIKEEYDLFIKNDLVKKRVTNKKLLSSRI